MRLPRTWRISASDLSSRSSPSNIIRPLTMRAAGGSRRRIVSASVVLPEPDSPTMPSVSPALQRERDVVDGAHHAGAPLGDVVGRQILERQQRFATT